MSGPHASVQALGGFSVTVDGRPVDAVEWRRRQAAALVKLLSLEPGHAMHRERVMDHLWPELKPELAATRLHKAAHFARKALGPQSSLVLRGEFVELFPDGEVEVDALAYEKGAARALAAQDAEAAARAADEYTGTLLPDDVYEAWADEPRQRLRLLQLDVLRLAGRWADLVALEPTDEEAHLALARSLAASGDARGALRQLDRLESELAHELGVEPGPAVVAMRELLVGEVERAAASVAVADVLVGREPQCSTLLENLPAGGSTGLRAVFVTGPAGSGKTALIQWLDRAATGRDLGVGIGVAGHVEGEWPYAPVLEALSDLCRRHPELLADLSPRLRSEMGDALSGRPVSWDGQGAHQRLYVAAAELVRRAADDRGLVLVIDDAHRADEASVSLVSHIARSLIDRPALLVIGARTATGDRLSELQQAMHSRGRAVQVDVGPLTREAAVTMARTLAPGASGEILDQIFQRSGGLPFGVAELSRRWSADPTADAFTAWIPPGLSAVDTDVLSRVSVLGTTFDTDEMAALTGLADDEVYAVIDSGLEHRVLIRERPYYSFRHRLIRETFVDAMTEADLMSAHRAAADALERLGRSPARVGHHLVEAGLVQQAVEPLLTAAETEAAHGAYRAALESLRLIEGAVSGARRQRLTAMRADLLYARGDLGAVDAYREALAVAEPEQRGRLLTRLAKAATSSGDLETAAQALSEVELDGSSNDAELLLVRGNLAFQRQDYEAADAAATEARDRIGIAGERWQLFDLIALQGLLAHLRGEWFQRLRVELRNTAERPDVAAGIFDSHLCVAEFLLYGPTPYDEVLVLADQLRTSAAESGVLRAVAFATALRGEAALLKGDLDLAEGELLDSVELHHELESTAGEAHSLQRLAEVHLARGDRATAESMLNRALPLARWSPIAPHLMQRVYGSLILAAPDPEAAYSVVERAEATLSAEDDCLFCTIMLDLPAAQASAAVGDVERARAYIASAETSAERWQGTAWHAAVAETKGHLAYAEGRADDGGRLMREAAVLFEPSRWAERAEPAGSQVSEPLPAPCRGTCDGLVPVMVVGATSGNG